MRRVLLCFFAALAAGLVAFAAPAFAATQSSDASINEYQENPGAAGGGQAGGHHGGNGSGHHGSGGSQQGGGSGGSGQGGSGGSGNGSGGSGGSAQAGGSGGPLPAKTAAQLEGQGSSGKALKDFTEQTGTAGQGATTGSGANQGGGSDSGRSDGGSSGFLSQVADGLKDFVTGADPDTGLGAGFPILLGVVLLGAVGLVIGRRRDLGNPR